MRKIILIIVLILSSYYLFAQTTFFKSYKSPSHERAFSAVETVDGNYLVVGEKRLEGYYGTDQGFITNLSPTGEIIDEIIMNPTDASRLCIILPFHYKEADYLCIGSSDSVAGDTNFGRIVFYGISSGMKIVFQKKFLYMKDYFLRPWQYTMQNDSILYLMHSYVGYKNETVGIIKYKLPFDSIASYHYTKSVDSRCQDIIFNKPGKYLDAIVWPGHSIIRLDENLIYISSKPYADIFPTNVSLTPIKNDDYLFTGSVINSKLGNLQLCCIRYNCNDKPLDSVYYTPSLDTNFQLGGRITTAINGNYIYFTGVYNLIPLPFPYNYNSSWVTVTKADMDLNILSIHFYGGDAQYLPFSIIPTKDGGCLINGYSYDYLTNLPLGDLELDMFALKVNADGVITNIPEHPGHTMSDAILYPNPGRDYLILQSGPQITGAEFTLYDMQGKSVLHEKINTTQLRINTTNLPAGIYPWQIVYKNKVIESGKWVKE